MSTKIVMGRDEASGAVAEVYAKLTSPEQRRALMKNIGVRAEAELRGWFYRRDADDPNKMGWPRQHFWGRVAKATVFDPSKTTENTATVNVAEPALGPKIATTNTTIVPIPPRRALALPMNAEAYGVLPRSGLIPGLFLLRSKAGNAFLVRKEGSGQFANLTFYYRLVPQTTVHPDPRALPEKNELGRKLSETAQSFYLRSGGSN